MMQDAVITDDSTGSAKGNLAASSPAKTLQIGERLYCVAQLSSHYPLVSDQMRQHDYPNPQKANVCRKSLRSLASFSGGRSIYTALQAN
jgi:hypothetical protein